MQFQTMLGKMNKWNYILLVCSCLIWISIFVLYFDLLTIPFLTMPAGIIVIIYSRIGYFLSIGCMIFSVILTRKKKITNFFCGIIIAICILFVLFGQGYCLPFWYYIESIPVE